MIAFTLIILIFFSPFQDEFSDWANTMWLTIVTYTTVGYGDTTPITVLGRTICVVTVFVVSGDLLTIKQLCLNNVCFRGYFHLHCYSQYCVTLLVFQITSSLLLTISSQTSTSNQM